MGNYPYPPAPLNTHEIAPSIEFRKAVLKVAWAIVMFFLVYVLLVLAAVGLAALCCIIGVWIFGAITNFLGLALGLGLITVGASVIFFLVKFIFATSKNEDPSRIRIYEKDQPELFAFLRQLAKDTRTRFPKKVFISPAVNACVFYNSNFLSMFFPVRKNLEIGLGLVNSVNLSEFKAIMAHEFGHFSQQSMKLGSFTYNVNRIIYNMLYENTGYARFINGWANIEGVFGMFAHITVAIAQAIQSILRGMYQFINKHYMGLSRQMEYNADAIAASVAGSNNLVSSLNRLDLSQSSYTTALDKAGEFLKQQKKSRNLFSNHATVMLTLAQQFDLQVQNGLPQVPSQFIKTFSRSRVNYKDQWASHPANHEREAELAKLNMESAPYTTSAWVLFREATQLQERVTDQVYQSVENAAQLETFDGAAFESDYREETERYNLPGVYGKYYNGRFVETGDWQLDIPEPGGNGQVSSLNELLTEEHCQLPEQIRSNERDIEILKAISEKQIDVKTFDFDGEKYDRDSAGDIIGRLEEEVAAQKAKLAALDKELYKAACIRALGKGMQEAEGIRSAYRVYHELNGSATALFDICGKVIENISPFYQGNITLDEINSRVGKLKQDLEIQLKARLRELLADPRIAGQLTEKLKQEMQGFIDSRYSYFLNNEFMNAELDSLINICTEVSKAIGDIKWMAYKGMLVKQAEASA